MPADQRRSSPGPFTGRTLGSLTGLAVGLFLAAAPLHAQEWHEAYRSRLTALARGDPARAAEALRRAMKTWSAISTSRWAAGRPSTPPWGPSGRLRWGPAPASWLSP